jgi:PAS domain S-box-containing protein
VFELVNPAYMQLVGHRDIVGMSVREALPEVEGQGFFELLDEVYLSGRTFTGTGLKVALQRKPGAPVEQRYVDLVYQPITDPDGSVTGIFVEGSDVTERVVAEAELRRNEARLRMVIDGARDYAILTFDANRRITSWSAGAEAAFGGSEAERIGTSADEIFTPEDRRDGVPEQEVATAAREGLAPDVRWHQRSDGGRVFMNGTLRPMSEEAGSAPKSFIKIVRDETHAHEQDEELARTQVALKASEAQFQAIVDSIDQMIWSTRPDGYHDFYNQRWYDYTGVPKGSTDGEGWHELFHPEDQNRAWALWRRSLETGEPYHIEYRLRHRSGQYRWVLGRAQSVRDPSGAIARWFGTCTDIQEIVEAREVLSRSREELERAVAERTRERNRVWEMSRDLFAIMGFDGHLKAINPAWEVTLGRDTQTLLALPFREQVHPDDHAAVETVMETLLRGKSVDRFEDRLRHADGSWRWISWAVVPEGEVFYAVGRDVTAEKNAASELETAQEALRQAQKMEAMGQLTGGVAHDFNNLLTPIVGALDMLQRKGLGGEREQRLIAGAMQSADRAKTLVQRLLAFARRQPLQPIAVNVGRLVEGMADLLASTTGPQVRVVVDVTPDLPPAKADPNQLEMALLNLGVNARDAMPDGGTLRMSATRESVRHPRGDLKRGQYVRLSVADTGSGMDEVTLARAIEPFFSTKGIGKGTGLGLSMVHGLVAQLGGALTIQSRRGVGTNVELWLPVSALRVDEAEPPGAPAAPGTARGLALLVDDEEVVRASTADMLEELGYRVQEAGSGEAALALVTKGMRPDLLVSDHLMPGMTGVDLARAVRELLPEMPVLIVSGYAEAEGIAPDLPRLTKPFRSAELAVSVAGLTSSGA